MATSRDRYESSSYYESRDKGRAQHAAQDLADTDYVCEYCGQPETGCQAARSGHSIAQVTLAQYASGVTTLDD